MDSTLLNSTPEERKEMIAQLKAQCDEETGVLRKKNKELDKRIDDIEDKAKQLRADNKAKLLVRAEVNKKIRAIKIKGDLLLILALLVVAASLIWLWDIHVILGIVGLAAALAAVVFGLIVRNGWKQYANEQKSANSALAAYDATQEELSKNKAELEKAVKANKTKIDELEDAYDKKIDVIKEFDRYAKYYQWEATLDNGHVAVFVTGELRENDTEPREPAEGKNYKSPQLNTLEFRFDDALCSNTIPKAYGKQFGMLAVAAVDTEETQDLTIRVVYQINNEPSERVSAPLPMAQDTKSKFIWYHISSYKDGTEIYAKTYDSFDALREAVNLTKDAVMQIL